MNYSRRRIAKSILHSKMFCYFWAIGQFKENYWSGCIISDKLLCRKRVCCTFVCHTNERITIAKRPRSKLLPRNCLSGFEGNEFLKFASFISLSESLSVGVVLVCPCCALSFGQYKGLRVRNLPNRLLHKQINRTPLQLLLSYLDSFAN